jgi:uncharacterized protein YodC (DUF2158 family)
MPQTVECPECGTRMKVKAETSRRFRVTCARCQARFTADGAEEMTTTAPRRAVQEETVDRPRRTSRRSGLDEDDRPRRRKPARSGGKGLWVLLGVGTLGLLLLGGGGVLAVVLMGRFGGGPPEVGLPGVGVNLPGVVGLPGLPSKPKGKVPARLLAYAPNDALSIKYVTLKNQREALHPSQIHSPFPLKMEDLERDYGPLEGIDEILLTQGYSTRQRGGIITVVSFNKPPDRAAVIAGGKELRAKGKTYYLMEEGNRHVPFSDYRHFASDTLLVCSESEVLLLEVINGDGGKFPAWFQGLIDEADGYHISVRRVREGGPRLSGSGAHARIECKWVEAGLVHYHNVEVYEDEQAARKGEMNYEKRPRSGEVINVRVSGDRVIAHHTVPVDQRNRFWR